MRAGAALALLSLVLAPHAARGQGYTAEVAVRASHIELRGLERDSLPDDQVPGEGLARALEDGTIVTCTPGDFCRWYPSGPVQGVALVTQDVRISAWPGIQGLAAHVHARGRYGSDGFWPRSDQEAELVYGYVSYERGDVRARAGRQFRVNGLGYYNFDGASVLWKRFDPIRVDVYGGWSLARNLHQPHTGSLLEDADEFAPDDRGWIVGVDLTARWRRALSGALTYQREIRTDRLALYTERVAGDVALRYSRISVDLSADYDLGFQEVNEAKLRAAAPLPHGLEAMAQVRRYTPHFELWTIWGAFSPVGFDEARGSLAWSVPGTALRLEAGGARREYEETDAGARFVGLDQDGWRGFGKAAWRWRSWFVDASYRADRGSGAARYGGDASVGYDFGGGSWIAARATSTQSFSEFRLGEQVTGGGGVDGALSLGDATITGSWAMYDLTYEGRLRVEDWTQQRAHLGVSYRFGSEPATGAGE